MEDQEMVYRHEVTLRKDSKRNLTTDKIADQVNTLVARVNTPGRVGKGWLATFTPDDDISVEKIEKSDVTRARGTAAIDSYNNRAIMHITCRPDRARPSITGEFQNIVSMLVAASNSFPNWSVEKVDGEEWASPEGEDARTDGAVDLVGYAPLNLPGNWREHFTHLYDRDPQIMVVMSALEAALESEWVNRFHVALMGPPACGKTELLATIKRMCGSDAVMVLDCTATTQAGLTKDLAEREELPRVIIPEEIEKASEDALRVLLGLLDTRGEIRKMTAREKVNRECKVLMFATVNDVDKFRTLLSGALASRFAHQVYCPRPDRSLMRRILQREVGKINGNAKWVDPCLDYLEGIRSSDPRQAIALCLCGRDGWLTGKYPDMLKQISRIAQDLQEKK